jgi:hypothetical protein
MRPDQANLVSAVVATGAVTAIWTLSPDAERFAVLLRTLFAPRAGEDVIDSAADRIDSRCNAAATDK